MLQELSNLSQKALELSSSERAALAHLLIASLDAGNDERLEEAWREEIDRRSARISEGLTTERSASEVIKDLRARLTS